MSEWQDKSLKRVQDILDQFYKMRIDRFGGAISQLYVVLEYIRRGDEEYGEFSLKQLEKMVGFRRRNDG